MKLNKDYIKETLITKREIFKSYFVLFILLLSAIGIIIFAIIKKEIDIQNIFLAICLILIDIVIFSIMVIFIKDIENLEKRLNDE
jgi:quinol-cytochrome oxidoreductase complex cytochrome b subunit